MRHVLLLGGTTEAAAMARLLADHRIRAVYSYAGRVAAPKAQPLPVRVGGFGGVEGLRGFLRAESISHVIDATHPFAATMSRNAAAACAAEGIPLTAHERPAWVAGPGDDWTHVPDMEAAVAALPIAPARVFLAIGRQHLAPFAARSDHHYLLRLVDPPDGPLPLPNCEAVIARGPFSVAGDRDLLIRHRIGMIVAKNSGGMGAEAKLIAARELGLPVLLIDRPAIEGRRVEPDPAAVLEWLDCGAGHGAERGV
jgi:precorrin-6A/cobalt-precorrin-6A reductase